MSSPSEAMFAVKYIQWRERRLANISVQLDEEIIGGIKAVSNSDQMQKREEDSQLWPNCPSGSTVNAKHQV